MKSFFKKILNPLKLISPSIYASTYRHMSGIEKEANKEIERVTNLILRESKDYKSPCFIDCGFNEGVILGKFINKLPDYTFFGYEMQTDLYDIVKKKFPHCNLKNSAIGTSDVVVDIYIKREYGPNIKGGSTTLLQEDYKEEYDTISGVKLVDVNDELTKIRQRHDFIVVKMDIEGAEYEILPHIFSYYQKPIDFLIIEYHPSMVDRKTHETAYSLVNQSDIISTEWY